MSDVKRLTNKLRKRITEMKYDGCILIDFNGISNCPGLFYVYKVRELCPLCVHIYIIV